MADPRTTPDDGTIVASRDHVYIRNHPDSWSQWRCSNGGYVTDNYVKIRLDNGQAVVLREGYGDV